VVWLWEQQRERMSWRGALGLGLAAGLRCACAGRTLLLLLRPDVMREMAPREGAGLHGRWASGALIVAAALAGAFPRWRPGSSSPANGC